MERLARVHTSLRNTLFPTLPEPVPEKAKGLITQVQPLMGQFIS